MRKATQFGAAALSALAVMLAISGLLNGCGQIDNAIAKRDLQVKMARAVEIEPVYLHPMSAQQKRVWVEFRDQTGHGMGRELTKALETALRDLGISVTDDPSTANIHLQPTLVYLDSDTEEGWRRRTYAGYGSGEAVLAGAAVGGTAGLIHGSPRAVAIGGLTGALVGAGAKALVTAMLPVNTFAVTVDVRISEKTKGGPVAQQFSAKMKQGRSSVVTQNLSENTDYQGYKNRLTFYATQTRLTFEEAQPHLLHRLLKSLAEFV